jgi:simple sugar transport system permease protein
MRSVAAWLASPMPHDVAAAPRLLMLPRSFAVALITLMLFATLLLIDGRDPVRAAHDTFRSVFGSISGFSELLVRMSPVLLTSVAVALPARMGLINVGGEGQLIMGAWAATAGALAGTDLPAWLLLPSMTALGFLGGALWAAIPGLLRAVRLVNETISTLLLNYIAPLIVSFFIFGPWRSADSASYPETPAFVDAARLPQFFGTRVHAGLIEGLFCVLLYGFVMQRTRWGLAIRAIGGNPVASLRAGLPIHLAMVGVMAVAGGIAGIAGMAELAGGRPWHIVGMAFLFALISSVGDVLQITQGVPYAVVNLLMAVILFMVLAQRGAKQ